MKFLFNILALVVISTGAFSQSFNLKTSHLAIHVEDVNKSAEFYMNILQFKETETPKGTPETIRWFTLSDHAQVHLIQSEELVELPKGIHLSFCTSDIEGYMEFLKSKNINFENWWGDKNQSNKRGDGITQIYLQDLDGYWIEINNDVR